MWPSGDNWSGSEQLQAVKDALFPASIVNLILNVIGVVAFYAFRANRVFPATPLAWIGVLNCFMCGYWIARFNGGQVSTDLILSTTISICRLALWADTFYSFGMAILNTLISLTLYISIYLRKDMESPKYFYAYVISFWVIMIPVPILNIYSPALHHLNNYGVCTITSPDFLGILIPILAMLVFQLYATTMALTRARGVIIAARSAQRSRRDLRMAFMLVRFSLTIFVEVVVVLNTTLVNLNTDGGIHQLKFLLIITALCPFFDAMILIFGNRPFMKLVISRVTFMSVSVSGSTNSNDLSPYSPNKLALMGRSPTNTSIALSTQGADVVA